MKAHADPTDCRYARAMPGGCDDANTELMRFAKHSKSPYILYIAALISSG